MNLLPGILFAGFLLLIGSSLLALTLFDYTTLLHWANEASLHGDASSYFTPALHQSIIKKLYGFSSPFILFGILGFYFKHFISLFYFNLQADAVLFYKNSKKSLRSIITEDKKIYLPLLFLIFIFGTLIRLYYGDQPIHSDEATVFLTYAKQPIYIILSAYNNVGNHIFHTLLLHFSWQLFGDSLWAIRLPTLIAGILLMPLTYLVIRQGYGRLTALFVTALVASSSALIEYTVNARGYEIQCFMVMCLLGLGQMLLKNSNRFAWVLWALLTALGFWTLPTHLYAYGGIALWFLISLTLQSETHGRRLQNTYYFFWANLAAALITLALYLPVYIVFGLGHMDAMVTHFQDTTLQDLGYRAFDLWQEWTRNIPNYLKGFIFITLLLGLLCQYKITRYRMPVLLAALIWLSLSSLIIPLYGATSNAWLLRLWLPFSLFFYLSVGVGITYCLLAITLFTKTKQSALFLGIPLCLVLLIAPVYQEYKHQYVYNFIAAFHDAKNTALYCKQNLTPGDAILAVCPHGFPLHYEFLKLHVPVMITWKTNDKGEKVGVYTIGSSTSTEAPPTTGRLFIIETAYANLQQALADSKLESLYKRGIHHVAQFPRANLYQVQTETSHSRSQ